MHSSLGARRPHKGRGALDNPGSRFQRERRMDEASPDEAPAPATIFIKDRPRTILSYNDSPDVGFEVGLNPYRGCEHGCAYCYARPTHEYLGLSAGLDFETRIMVKDNAPALLASELAAKNWSPQVIALSGVTDPYQPAEKKFTLTRQCLEVLCAFQNPVCVVTKNSLIIRDQDLLSRLARLSAVSVYISLTTLDDNLARVLEPRAPLPGRRLAAIRALSAAGIPTGVLAAPMIPGLNDEELPALLKAAADAGSGFAGLAVLRLPHGVKNLFADWLEENLPNKKDKILNRVRTLRGGKLNDSRFSVRMKGQGIFADQIAALFSLGAKKAGLARHAPALSTAHFLSPHRRQRSLF